MPLELSPDVEAHLLALARRSGITVEAFLRHVVREWRWNERLENTPEAAQTALSGTQALAHLQKTDPKEWALQFHAWAESHDRTTPLLSDEAISRDSIYSNLLLSADSENPVPPRPPAP